MQFGVYMHDLGELGDHLAAYLPPVLWFIYLKVWFSEQQTLQYNLAHLCVFFVFFRNILDVLNWQLTIGCHCVWDGKNSSSGDWVCTVNVIGSWKMLLEGSICLLLHISKLSSITAKDTTVYFEIIWQKHKILTWWQLLRLVAPDNAVGQRDRASPIGPKNVGYRDIL